MKLLCILSLLFCSSALAAMPGSSFQIKPFRYARIAADCTTDSFNVSSVTGSSLAAGCTVKFKWRKAAVCTVVEKEIDEAPVKTQFDVAARASMVVTSAAGDFIDLFCAER